MKGPFKRMVVLHHNAARSGHYVCFDCRWQYAKPTSTVIVRDAEGRTVRSGPYGFDSGVAAFPCPLCGQPMTGMGHNFRPPPSHDVEAWAVVRRLAAEGFKHGGNMGWRYPTRLKDVPAFLEAHRRKSLGEHLLTRWAAKK